MENRLLNKTVLITGASSGIGAACAHEFAKYQANLVLTGRRVERLEALKQELTAKYAIKAFVIGMDVTKPKQVATAFNHLPASIEKIDVLINNAGLSQGLEKFVTDDPQNWETMIDTNLKGFLAVLQLVVTRMVKQGSGHIFNIGSIAGVEAYAKGGVYCATKHAVHAITQSLREELVEHGIRVSEILPGAVHTEFSLVRFKGDYQRADQVYQGFKPLDAADVAEVIAFNANLPQHVNVAETLILASAQSRATKIYRQ
jgi:3-hydroxy acid dehydrogenase/malonic semialdehyde reductase